MKPQQALPIPSRESTSNGQLQALLFIAQSLQPYLILPPQEGANIPQSPALDGGTVSAAAATFIKTCARIDELLADGSRWNLEAQDALYSALVVTQEHQQKYLAAQTIAVEALSRPCMQLKPLLAVLDNGYVAVYGDLTNGASVVGYGATPEAAFADFDLAWKRQAAEQNVILPTEEAIPVAPPENPEKKTSKRKKK